MHDWCRLWSMFSLSLLWLINPSLKHWQGRIKPFFFSYNSTLEFNYSAQKKWFWFPYVSFWVIILINVQWQQWTLLTLRWHKSSCCMCLLRSDVTFLSEVTDGEVCFLNLFQVFPCNNFSTVFKSRMKFHQGSSCSVSDGVYREFSGRSWPNPKNLLFKKKKENNKKKKITKKQQTFHRCLCCLWGDAFIWKLETLGNS